VDQDGALNDDENGTETDDRAEVGAFDPDVEIHEEQSRVSRRRRSPVSYLAQMSGFAV
jgi:hypothetical protein